MENGLRIERHIAATGTTQEVEASCLVPGMTFQGIRTPSCASRFMNSAIVDQSKLLLLVVLLLLPPGLLNCNIC
ncbi:hypothetical protein G4B88_021838 [Cannabis sativa]|uniref:Uncharacterized protein n=1 Tax=Cannabis sativa TaxID=3483 RepID=A0A7J6GYV3_CANSA|nr:hypothetical protein G4B88_021838 [Cannabis sativa]